MNAPATSIMLDNREQVAITRVDLEELFRQARAIQGECRDFSVSNATSKNVYFDGDHCKLKYKPDGDKTRGFEMTKYSLGQLCNKIGVPVRYIDKCIDSGRLDLAAENVNSWLDDFGKNLFIREYQNKIRGVLSDRYSVLDTPDIMEVLADVIPFDDYTIKGHFLTFERFHARIIQRDRMNIDGEDLFAGIQIDSSDVGRSILTVQFMIFKQVCTNGLCISRGGGMLFSQKHIGIDKSDFRDNFQKSIGGIPTLIEHSKELIEAARTDDKYSVAHFNEKQLQDFIERVKIKTKLPEDGVQKVIQLMTDRYGSSTWGFVNSLTEVAQDYTLERRLEVEKTAGEILLAA